MRDSVQVESWYCTGLLLWRLWCTFFILNILCLILWELPSLICESMDLEKSTQIYTQENPEWKFQAMSSALKPARKAAPQASPGNSVDSRDKQPRRPTTGGIPRFADHVPDVWQWFFLLYALPVLKAIVAFSVTWKWICCSKRSTCPISLVFFTVLQIYAQCLWE